MAQKDRHDYKFMATADCNSADTAKATGASGPDKEKNGMNGKACWCCKSSQSCECNADACYECGACPMHCKCEEGFIACECEYHGDQAEARYYCRVHGPNGINDKRRKAQEAADNFAWAETMRGVFGNGA